MQSKVCGCQGVGVEGGILPCVEVLLLLSCDVESNG